MSMITEQVEELRNEAELLKYSNAARLLQEAANTLEMLAVKVSAENGGGWIPTAERLPEERINPITKNFYSYQCTFKIGDVYDVRFYQFGRGHWWHGLEIYDGHVTAWRERPEPYKEDGAEIIDVIQSVSTIPAIPIPENATNGDMIKALFPCLEKYEYEEPYTHGIALAGNDNRVTWFANEWWNAPYKRGDTE